MLSGLVRGVAGTVVGLGLAAAPLMGAAGAQPGPTLAPVTEVSADGRTGTDGVRTLGVSRVADLDPAGVVLNVSGSGYDEAKGIYVALCVITPRSHAPSPCGGGVDTEGSQGAAQWISSNPPSYGVGVALPYGPGGSFVTSFSVRAEISTGIDCRQVRCAVVTRNDHTRPSDRSQDLVIPVTFRAAPATTTAPPTGGGPAPTAPAMTTPTVTVPPLASTTTTVPAPVSTVTSDGLAASDGTRTLRVSAASGIDPAGQALSVRGEAFDERRGIYVGLCAISPDGEAPGPCLSGAPNASRWVSSNPPDYGADLSVPYEDGGAFTVELAVAAVIDDETDCRGVACAVVVRADTGDGADRSLDLSVPVAFAATSDRTAALDGGATGTALDGGGEDTESASDVIMRDSSSETPIVLIVAIVAVLTVAASAAVVLRRGRAAATEGTAGAPATDPPSSPTSDDPTGPVR